MSETSNTPNQYDVIIVGGGPGGASAAYGLCQAGQRVLVLEKASLPRYKTCGGGLSFRMLRKYFPFSFEPVIETHCQAISYALGGQRVSIPLPAGEMGLVMRDRFDAYLLEQSGAQVCPGMAVRTAREEPERVIVETASGEQFQARYLIGADGASSTVARSLGLRRAKRLVAAIEVEVPATPEQLAHYANGPLFIFGEIRLGYLWIFPKADHLSVGIGAYRPRPGELQSTLRKVMARYKISLDGAVQHGHPIPVWTGAEPIATPRVLLVGDAAGLVDPLSGEGIRLAIKSGRLAAKAILAGRPDLYTGWIRSEVGLSQTLALPLVPIFYFITWLAFQLGVRNPLASQAFMDLLSDEADYADVLLRIFGTLPYFMLVELVGGAARVLGGSAARSRLRQRAYGLDHL